MSYVNNLLYYGNFIVVGPRPVKLIIDYGSPWVEPVEFFQIFRHQGGSWMISISVSQRKKE